MKTAILKEGSEINLEIWNNSDLKGYFLRELRPLRQDTNDAKYVGFDFFGPVMFKRRSFNRNDYSRESDHSDLEKQDARYLTDHEYDRSIVGLNTSQEVIGIAHYTWLKCNNVWSYYPSFLDVRKDMWDKKVATNLIKRLNEPCFMWGKIFVGSGNSKTDLGEKYLSGRKEKYLRKDKFKMVSPKLESELPVVITS